MGDTVDRVLPLIEVSVPESIGLVVPGSPQPAPISGKNGRSSKIEPKVKCRRRVGDRCCAHIKHMEWFVINAERVWCITRVNILYSVIHTR